MKIGNVTINYDDRRLMNEDECEITMYKSGCVGIYDNGKEQAIIKLDDLKQIIKLLEGKE